MRREETAACPADLGSSALVPQLRGVGDKKRDLSAISSCVLMTDCLRNNVTKASLLTLLSVFQEPGSYCPDSQVAEVKRVGE
jgi:hypothetical protein